MTTVSLSTILASPSPIFSLFFFFFYCYRHHRDLHSFPTRRSSDLGHVGDKVAVRDADPFRGPCRAGGVDRKSTRLNSSHLGISYAVFCLKKKKKKKK